MKFKALLALVLGASLVTAPVARAHFMDEGSGTSSLSAEASSTLGDTYFAMPYKSVRNDPSVVIPYVAQQYYGHQSVALRPDVLGGNGVTSSIDLPTVSAPSNGFEWSDAGVGAATMFGAIALALLSLTAVKRSRRLGF